LVNRRRLTWKPEPHVTFGTGPSNYLLKQVGEICGCLGIAQERQIENSFYGPECRGMRVGKSVAIAAPPGEWRQDNHPNRAIRVGTVRGIRSLVPGDKDRAIGLIRRAGRDQGQFLREPRVTRLDLIGAVFWAGSVHVVAEIWNDVTVVWDGILAQVGTQLRNGSLMRDTVRRFRVILPCVIARHAHRSSWSHRNSEGAPSRSNGALAEPKMSDKLSAC
jgi:hypothetical protein